MKNCFKLKRSMWLLGLAGLLTTPISVAQNSQIEEVVVTGSLIKKRSGYEGSSPVAVVDKEMFKAQGVADLVDLAGNLTVNAGSIVSQETGNLIGTSQFNIRNLGAGSTLTLINGRRGGISTVSDASGNLFFDSKQLPLAMIERVDVQTDGASVTYGSDAVGGVVNLITRKGFEGLELSARYQDASNESYSLNLASGIKSDNASFNLYATYYGQTRNHRTDFDWMVERIHGNGVLTDSKLTSSTGSPGTYLPVSIDENGVITKDGNRHPDADCEAALGVLKSGRCRFNFSDQVAPIPQEDRFQVFTEMEWNLSDRTTLYSELSYSMNDIQRTQGANSYSNGMVSGGSIYIPADHPFNFWVEDTSDPSGESLTYIAPEDWDNGVHTAVDLACECRPFGAEMNGEGNYSPYSRDIDLDYVRWMGGFEHSLGDTWVVNADYIFARSTRNFQGLNWYNSVTLNQSVVDGTFNPFGNRIYTDLVSPKDGVSTAGNSEDAIMHVMNLYSTMMESTQQVVDVVASGDLFEIESGTVQAAFGVQARRDERITKPDELTSKGLGNSSSPGAGPSDASQDVYAVFGEMSLPLADNLEVSAALRYEDYGDNGGSTVDPKIALRWDATENVAVRASWGTAFQGPTIPQSGRSSSTTFIDDAAVYNATTGKMECGAGGDDSIVIVRTQGSDNLAPQSSENFNLGVIFRPIDDMQVSLDYWSFDYTDLITQDEGAQAIVDNDCDDGVLNDPRIIRSGSGQLRIVNSEFINTGSVSTNGLDLVTNYDLPFEKYGEFRAGLNLTYVNKFEVNDGSTTFDGVGSRNFKNQFGSMPQIRAAASLNWNSGDHNANLFVKYIDSYKNDQFNDYVVDSFTSVDVNYSTSIRLLDGEPTSVKVGVRNLLDEDPPSLGDKQRPAYDDRVHDIRGRAMYLEVMQSF